MAKRTPLVFEGGEIIEQLSTDTFEVGNGTLTVPGSTEDRTLAERFADAVNVKDYGAKGDGETDDTVAFRNAATAAAAKGGVVYVPHGTYKVTDPVTGEFISFGHPTFTGAASSAMDNQLVDLYDDYVFARKNKTQTITGNKTFAVSPLVPTPAATDNSQKAINSAWMRNAVSGNTTGLAFDDSGKLKVDPSGMSKDALEDLIKSLIPNNATDGFELDSNGKLKVKPEELISGGDKDGLGLDSNGKIKVLPSELAGNGLSGNDSTGKLTVTPKTNGGITVDSNGVSVNVNDLIPGTASDGFEVSNGKLQIKPAEFVGSNTGLKVTSGKIGVDSDYLAKIIAESMSSDDNDGEKAVNTALMLAQLGLPINLSSAVTWYVKASGTNVTNTPTYAQLIACSQAVYPNTPARQLSADKLPDGKTTADIAKTAYMVTYGWGRDANYAFKTIQKAIDFVCNYHTLPSSDCTIMVGAGTYNEKLKIKNYSTAGGELNIKNLNYAGARESISSANKVIVIASGSNNVHTISCSNVNVNVYGLELQLNLYGGGATTNTSSCLYATSSGELKAHDCRYIINDYTAVAENETTATTDANAARHCLASKNGTIEVQYNSYFEVTRQNARSGTYIGKIMGASINSTCILNTTDDNITIKGDMAGLFGAQRQSLIMCMGIRAPSSLTINNLKLGQILSLQTGSGFQLNNLCNTSTLHGISAHSGESAKENDTVQTSQGCWLSGYTAYSNA